MKKAVIIGCGLVILAFFSQCDRDGTASADRYAPLMEKASVMIRQGKFQDCYAFIDSELGKLEGKAKEQEKALAFFPKMSGSYAYHELDGAGCLLQVKIEALRKEKRFDDFVPVWERIFHEFPHFQNWSVPGRISRPGWDARVDWVKYQLVKTAQAGSWDTFKLPHDTIFDGTSLHSAITEWSHELLSDPKTLESVYHEMTTLPRWQNIWYAEIPDALLEGAVSVEAKFEPLREESWHRLQKKVEQWVAAFPDSQLAKIGLARFWIDYAWNARGFGWADTVTPEGWRLMAERLAKARTLLDGIPRDLPSWYPTRLTICLGEASPGKETLAIAGEGITKFPWHAPIYLEMLQYLLPRWHGQAGDWQKFAKLVGDQFGPEHYLLICLHGYGIEGAQSITEGQVDWKILKEAFEARIKAIPDNTFTQNSFARFSWIFKDKSTAKSLFVKIGNKPHEGIWGAQEDEFWKAKTWAEN